MTKECVESDRKVNSKWRLFHFNSEFIDTSRILRLWANCFSDVSNCRETQRASLMPSFKPLRNLLIGAHLHTMTCRTACRTALVSRMCLEIDFRFLVSRQKDLLATLQKMGENMDVFSNCSLLDFCLITRSLPQSMVRYLLFSVASCQVWESKV